MISRKLTLCQAYVFFYLDPPHRMALVCIKAVCTPLWGDIYFVISIRGNQEIQPTGLNSFSTTKTWTWASMPDRSSALGPPKPAGIRVNHTSHSPLFKAFLSRESPAPALRRDGGIASATNSTGAWRRPIAHPPHRSQPAALRITLLTLVINCYFSAFI